MNNKSLLIRIVIFVFFIALVLSLINLQIIKYPKYKTIAEKNYIRIQTIESVRGEIFDRNYRPIVTNVPTYDLYIVPGRIKNKKNVSEFVSETLNVNEKIISDIIRRNRFRLYNEVLLKKDISFDNLSVIYENLNYYPSLVVKTGFKRKYAYNNLFTGYIHQISKSEYKKHKGYSINSMIGKSGLEKYYEKILKGKNGKRILQVDSKGKI